MTIRMNYQPKAQVFKVRTTAITYSNGDYLEKLKELGFEFTEPVKGKFVVTEKEPIIQISSIEELIEFIGEYGCIAIIKDNKTKELSIEINDEF